MQNSKKNSILITHGIYKSLKKIVTILNSDLENLIINESLKYQIAYKDNRYSLNFENSDAQSKNLYFVKGRLSIENDLHNEISKILSILRNEQHKLYLLKKSFKNEFGEKAYSVLLKEIEDYGRILMKETLKNEKNIKYKTKSLTEISQILTGKRFSNCLSRYLILVKSSSSIRSKCYKLTLNKEDFKNNNNIYKESTINRKFSLAFENEIKSLANIFLSDFQNIINDDDDDDEFANFYKIIRKNFLKLN